MFLCVDRQDRNKFNETLRNLEKEKRNYKIINSITSNTKLEDTVKVFII